MKIKRKGAYEYQLEMHKNHSALIIPMAAEAYLMLDKDIESFIINHKDIYDFMLRTKVPRSSKLVAIDDEGNETVIQNVTRYYISTEGVSLIKIMPPLDKEGILYKLDKDKRFATTKVEKSKLEKKGYVPCGTVIVREDRRIGINTGQKVTICNNIKDFAGNIDYSYYIEEAYKLTQ